MSDQQTYTILDTRGERRTIAQGTTTDAPSGLPAFKNPLKEMMCIVMCACKKLFENNRNAPELSTDGMTPGPDAAAAAPETEGSATEEPRKLQQNCVAALFQSLDEAAEYKSWVKAEVYYDMDGYRFGFRNMADRVQRRPQPLMSRNTQTKPLKWHWGVISHVGRRKNPTLSQPTFILANTLSALVALAVLDFNHLHSIDVIVHDPPIGSLLLTVGFLVELHLVNHGDVAFDRRQRRVPDNDDVGPP